MKNNLFESLLGLNLTNVLFQPTEGLLSPDNMFVLNFENEKSFFSLHVFCFLRVMMNNRILLVSSDEVVSMDYHILDSNASTKNSIIYHNIKNVQQMSYGAIVSQAVLYDCGDVEIRLSNDMVIEIKIDCSIDGYEYYRLFDYYGTNQLVVCNKKGRIVFDWESREPPQYR